MSVNRWRLVRTGFDRFVTSMKNATFNPDSAQAPSLVNHVLNSTATNIVEWHPDGLLANLFIDDLEVIQLTKDRPQEDMVRRLVAAAVIGAKAMNMSEQAMDVGFVRHLLDQHTQSTAAAVSDVITKTQTMLNDQFDGESGKALEPIRIQVRSVEESVTNSLAEILETLDPSRPDSDLGKALGKLSVLLDEDHVNSVPSRIKSIVDRLAAQDGALAISMKSAVSDALKTQIEPLCKQVRDLESEILKEKAAKEAVNVVIQSTTAKGFPFEEEAFARCKAWALAAGGQAEHVGVDNKPGDVLITFSPEGMAATDLRVIVEARDDATAKGRKPIGDDLAKAMAHREADAGIYCGKNSTALAREIGEWDEGSVCGKQWIACTVDQLPQALRLILLTKRVQDRASAAGAVDAAGVNASLVEIRVALRRVATIKRASTAIANSATSVQSESDALLRQIETALSNAEHAMRASAATDQVGLEI